MTFRSGVCNDIYQVDKEITPLKLNNVNLMLLKFRDKC